MIVTRKMAEDAAEVLGWGRAVLGEELTSEDITAQYRAAAKGAHPDAGGTMERFVAVDRAKHVLLAWLARSEPPQTSGAGQECPRCEGRGFVVHQRAFRAMRVMCPMCRGSGDLDTEHEKWGDR